MYMAVFQQIKRDGTKSLLPRQLQADAEEAHHRERVPTGQQAVWRVLDCCRTNAHLARVYDLADLQAIRPKGQDFQSIALFRRDWENMALRVTGTDKATKTQMLLERMDTVELLQMQTF